MSGAWVLNRRCLFPYYIIGECNHLCSFLCWNQFYLNADWRLLLLSFRARCFVLGLDCCFYCFFLFVLVHVFADAFMVQGAGAGRVSATDNIMV